MSNLNEKPVGGATEIEAQPASTAGPVYESDEKVDYNRNGAIDAERIEHDMTVLQAVKAYPAASFWAFTMSCTIVSVPRCGTIFFVYVSSLFLFFVLRPQKSF